MQLHQTQDRKSGSAGMPRPISYAVFCLKKKKKTTKKQKCLPLLQTHTSLASAEPGRCEVWPHNCVMTMYEDICDHSSVFLFFFFFNDTATTEIYTLSLHDALPI